MVMKVGDADVWENDVGAALEAARWTFAKTMPDNPHSYTVIKHWNDSALTFKDVARFIKVCGTPRKWGSMRKTYFDFGDYSYWAMDDDWRDTVLINRCARGWVDPFPRQRVRA